jgi:hypothetical protein
VKTNLDKMNGKTKDAFSQTIQKLFESLQNLEYNSKW